jgi:hypothetical protein
LFLTEVSYRLTAVIAPNVYLSHGPYEWGVVVNDEPTALRLHTGRIAKKVTRRVKWMFADEPIIFNDQMYSFSHERGYQTYPGFNSQSPVDSDSEDDDFE